MACCILHRHNIFVFFSGVPMSWLVDSIMASAAAQMVRNMGLSDADILRAAHYWCRHRECHDLAYGKYAKNGAWVDLAADRFSGLFHDDVIKWKDFPRNWPFVRGIHRSPVNSPHKGEWRGALMFSLICVWINDWVNNREAGGLRRYRAHYDVIGMRIR